MTAQDDLEFARISANGTVINGKRYAHGRKGGGKVVHYLHIRDDGTATDRPICGAGGAGQLSVANFREKKSRPTTDPVTCKRCLSLIGKEK